MLKSKYAEAGVDFEKEHDVVGILKALYEATLPFTEDLRKIGIIFPEEEGDFSGGFQVDVKKLLENGIEKYVSQQCVDGPGSKPVAHALYSGEDPVKLGCTSIDSIAMVVNDLLCSGARPVSLVEYHSWNDPGIEIARQMAEGNLIGAELSKATIIGGENASLSAMITGPVAEKAYDMCHMAYGIILDKELIDNPLGKGRVNAGNAVIGISSSGLHCNGITLAWKTAIDYKNKGYKEADRINEKVDSLGKSVAEAILTPTIIYVKPVLEVLAKYGNKIKAIVNITGEGVHNMRRVLPEQTGLQLDYSKHYVKKPHPIFNWVQEHGEVSISEMYEDYNMGTGMALIVDKDSEASVIHSLNNHSKKRHGWDIFKAYPLGEVVKDKKELIELISHEGSREVYKPKKG